MGVLADIGTEQDSHGAHIEIWSSQFKAWGRIQTTAGAEGAQAGQIKARLTHQVTTRFRTGYKPNMRILFNSRLLDIELFFTEIFQTEELKRRVFGSSQLEIEQIVDTENRNAELVIGCKEIVVV